MDKFVLIDGNSLLNRAFYATPQFTTKEGFPSNGIFGFVKLLLKIINDKKPKYLAVAFDVHAPTFRHKMYGEYKAGRKPMPAELAVQMPVLKELLHLMCIKTVELEGYEADDLIGTLSRRFPVHSYIYTGDRDAYQLVDKNVNVCFTRKGVSDLLELNDKNFEGEVGLMPAQIIDLKALMGDKSDNIPGVSGIGEQTAKDLLKNYGSIEGVYAHIGELSVAQQKRLELGRDSAKLSYTLATIDLKAPVDCALDDCALRLPFPYSVRQKFAELDFRSLSALDCFETPNGNEFIAAEQKTDSATPETEKAVTGDFSCAKIESADVTAAMKFFENNKSEYIACVYSDTAFCFLSENLSLDEKQRHGARFTEYTLRFKENLLDGGIDPDELKPLFEKIFYGDKTVICYDVKSFMHLLSRYDIKIKAKTDDVGLAKYLAEGSSVSETLLFQIDARGYDSTLPALGLYRLYFFFYDRLSEEEKKLYREIELPLVEVLFDMEQTGVRVNLDMIDELSVRYNKELQEVTAKIHREAGEVFNLNSPVQLKRILFDKLKIDEKSGAASDGKQTKAKKNAGTSAEILEKYAEDHEIVRLVLRYRQVQKLLSTYITGIRPLVIRGRVHTTYNQSNTSTGRLSSANPNLQNIPVRTDEGRELRKLFIASEGNVFIDADYSQIELRVMAHLSGCEALKEAYRSGGDIHALTASQVFGVPIYDVTPKMRREAKAVNFGIIYGISAFGLSKDLGISAKSAKEYIDKYFETYSEVKTYIDSNVETAKKNGYVTTLYGRKREINELKSSNFAVRAFGERAAMNMPLQGTSADIIKIAMVRVYQRMKKEGLNAKLVLQVHDELVVDCPENERERVEKILKFEMEHAAELSVPLVAEIGVGKSWYETH